MRRYPSDSSSSGEYRPRFDLTRHVWHELCDGHYETYSQLQRMRELRASVQAAGETYRQVIGVAVSKQVTLGGRLVAPYHTLYDEFGDHEQELRTLMLASQHTYDRLRAHWTRRANELLRGRVISAVATEDNTLGFEIYERGGIIPGVYTRNVKGPYHSFEPANGVLRIGSQTGGVNVQLVTPGNIYERQVDILVHARPQANY